MTSSDVAEVASLWATRDGIAPPPVQRVADWLTASDRWTLVAIQPETERVLGYGRAARLADVKVAPDGHYLTGLVVHPEVRRAGIGRALTLARMALLAELDACECFYVANAQNAVSIALHAACGFEARARLTTFPGIHLEGEGQLFGCALG